MTSQDSSADKTALDDGTLEQSPDELAQAAELSRPEKSWPAEIPGYKMLRCLGEGAYGSVWLARDENTGKHVSVKFYTHRRGLDWTLLNREVEKLAVLDASPNIVGLLDVGWDSDPPYYVMEYLQNGSLAGVLDEKALSPNEAVRIARGVLLALVHAHGSGVLHCDLKPANVLLDAHWEPRICDFGQSRLSHEQDPALGTLFYMAPEQADLEAIPDARWDVYALGALLYQMLCGHAPYRTEENERRIRAAETLEGRLAEYRRILRDDSKPDAHRRIRGVDRRLVEIVDRCLAIDPQERFPNAQSVLDMLESREQARSRRPVLVFGVLGPTLLLAAVLPFVGNAMRSAVVQAEENQIDLALASDVETANIVAAGVQFELSLRQQELVDVAESDRLRELVARQGDLPLEERGDLIDYLAAQKERLDEQRAETRREPDTSWFLTNAAGTQVWREPFNEVTIDRNYAHRDYFHGRRKEFDPAALPPDLTPIRRPYLSTPFRSQATGRYMVAISVPVWDSSGEQVIGVLARTIHLEDLRTAFGQILRGQGAGHPRRLTVLVDHRNGRILAHPWMTEDHMEQLSAKQFRRMSVDVPAIDAVRDVDANHASSRNGPVDIRDERYHDPIGQVESFFPDEDPRYAGTWLAAFCPVGRTGWTAIVQEHREAALAPVGVIRNDMVRYAIWAMIVGCTLIAALWYFVLRAMEQGGNVVLVPAGPRRPSSGSDSTVTDAPSPTHDAGGSRD